MPLSGARFGFNTRLPDCKERSNYSHGAICLLNTLPASGPAKGGGVHPHKTCLYLFISLSVSVSLAGWLSFFLVGKSVSRTKVEQSTPAIKKSLKNSPSICLCYFLAVCLSVYPSIPLFPSLRPVLLSVSLCVLISLTVYLSVSVSKTLPHASLLKSERSTSTKHASVC